MFSKVKPEQITDRQMDKLLKDLFWSDWKENKEKKNNAN